MRALTAEQIEARYERGFGRGTGEGYRPWLQVHDVPSRGRSTRLNGRRVNRQHLTLSDIERHTLLAVQRLDAVVDIREQFPLWPLAETLEIADELKVGHPTHPTGRLPVLMTSDLVLTVGSGQEKRLEVIACKPSEELGRRGTLEKLEIERVYWARRDTRWNIVTERDMSAALVFNLEWIDEWHEVSPTKVAPADLALASRHIRELLPEMWGSPLNRICQQCDQDLGLKTGSSIVVFRHALARKTWRAPLGEKLVAAKPLPGGVLAALRPDTTMLAA